MWHQHNLYTFPHLGPGPGPHFPPPEGLTRGDESRPHNDTETIPVGTIPCTTIIFNTHVPCTTNKSSRSDMRHTHQPPPQHTPTHSFPLEQLQTNRQVTLPLHTSAPTLQPSPTFTFRKHCNHWCNPPHCHNAHLTHTSPSTQRTNHLTFTCATPAIRLDTMHL